MRMMRIIIKIIIIKIIIIIDLMDERR